MSASTPFDPGLQPERTELAWRRTALSIGVGSIVAARLLPVLFGDPLLSFPGIAGVVFAGVIWLAARRRGVAYTMALTQERAATVPGSRLLLVLATACAMIGVLGALVVAFSLTG